MDYLRQLWKGGERKVKNSSEVAISEKAEISCDNDLSADNVSQEVIKPVPNHWDPKVVEFFQHFPEPYRQKAIERFSKRDGLFRFSLFREVAMYDEMRAAREGVFKEDQREYDASLERSYQEQQAEEWEKEKRLFETREIPEWEQKVLKYVPLQPGDQMWFKLAISANVSALGLAFLANWNKYQKSIPKPPRQKLVRTFIGSLGVCCFLQVCAAYRMMDWGPFDKTTDHRNLVDKVTEDCKKDLQMFIRYMENWPPKT